MINHPTINNLQKQLISVNHETHRTLVIDKTEKALADIRRALTYLEKAEAILIWAEANK